MKTNEQSRVPSRAADLIAQYERTYHGDQSLTPLEESALRDALKTLDIRRSPKDLSELALVSSPENYYTDDGKYNVVAFGGQLLVTDVSDGSRPGKRCPFIEITNTLGPSDYPVTRYLKQLKDEKGVTTLDGLFDEVTDSFENRDQNLRVEVGHKPSKNVFSPFGLDRIKPLTKLPRKFTADHLIKAIANGQYDVLASGYKKDSGPSYAKGDALNPVIQLKDLIKKWVSVLEVIATDDGTLTVHFGSYANDDRACVVNLSASH